MSGPDIRPRPAPGVSGRIAYRRPRHAAPIELDLSANEGAAPPVDPGGLPGAIRPDDLRRYPDASPLEAILAQRFEVDVEQVVVTAGADDAIARALRSVACPGRSVVVPVPAFEMIERDVAHCGARAIRVPWSGPAFPLDAVLSAATNDTAAVVVASPNNPTGATATAADVGRLLRELPGTLVIVDQAYAEYAREDLAAVTLSRPNGLLIRTLSKAWGLAGLRLGLAVGTAEVIGWLRAAGQPYAVSRLSLRLAERALRDDEYVRRHVARVRQERRMLGELLSRLGARPSPSEANFVLAQFADSRWVADGLAGLGIAVRRFPGQAGLEACLRITCPGDPGAWERLERALGAVMSPEALVFDMDGTLADTTGSYDEAILRTVSTFGLDASREQVEQARRRGHASNDWDIAAALLEAHGGTSDRDEIARRFERLYQGTSSQTGLRSRERLIPDRGLLGRLARRRLLGIATGRPRADLQCFLRKEGIADLFDAVVAMEDAPGKPDPAPVRRALRQLGVTRAWMIGDTPDDVRAARAAGVVPIGVVPPGASAGHGDALRAAGAARVLERIDDIEELLT